MVFVIKGGNWTLGNSTLDLNDSTLPIVRMEGLNKSALAGFSLSDGADFNGDGRPDICFSMPGFGFDPLAPATFSAPGAVSFFTVERLSSPLNPSILPRLASLFLVSSSRETLPALPTRSITRWEKRP
jgi:hypothetical protein